MENADRMADYAAGQGRIDMDLLISVASGLGSAVEDTVTGARSYKRTDDCVGGFGCCRAKSQVLHAKSLWFCFPHADCLKDLQRFLRKDDPDMRPVFFKLGGFHLAANDLVPLVVTYPNEHDVVYNARECF
jgi:timeless